MPSIRDPLPDISCKITEALGALPERRRTDHAGPTPITGLTVEKICISATRVYFSPRITSPLCPSGCPFPLCLTRQPRPGPSREVLCLLPAHTIDRVLLSIPCIITIFRIIIGLAAGAVLNTASVFSNSDLSPRELKGTDRDLSLRSKHRGSIGILTSHREAPGRERDPF